MHVIRWHFVVNIFNIIYFIDSEVGGYWEDGDWTKSPDVDYLIYAIV
jgi:hypothetical protein